MPVTTTTRPFTVDEYYRMAEAGILAPGERVELIEGEIVRMAAIGSRHAGTVMRLNRLLTKGVEARGLMAVQSPVRLDDLSEPEPDVGVLRPRADDYTATHPGPDDVLLVVEVADTTLTFDRDTKTPLYAAAGIPEYWLVNLPDDRIEVFREPAGEGYGRVTEHHRGDVLRPEAFPDLEVAVDVVLP